MAEWVGAFLSATFEKAERLYRDEGMYVCFHDPVCVWYALGGEGWEVKGEEDVRVETGGQWTRGMCVVDRRGRRGVEGGGEGGEGGEGGADGGGEGSGEGEAGKGGGDHGGWLDPGKGNRIGRCVGTPGARALALVLLGTIFGG